MGHGNPSPYRVGTAIGLASRIHRKCRWRGRIAGKDVSGSGMPEAKARRVKEQSRCGLQRRLRCIEIAALKWGDQSRSCGRVTGGIGRLRVSIQAENFAQCGSEPAIG